MEVVMAMQKRMKVNHGDVFPMGAFLKGTVEAVADFNAESRPDGSRPQSYDKETGLPVWQVTVIDADEEAGKKDTAITVKFVAKHQPVPPENTTPFPMTPVEFTGLTALAWIDDNGPRPRIAWSYRAEEMVAPINGNRAEKASSAGASSSSSSTASSTAKGAA